jgi:hypothetical protein
MSAKGFTKGSYMELQFATVEDMIHELHRRNVPFVLVAMENTNRADAADAWIAGQGKTQLDILNLCRLGAQTFRRLHHAHFPPHPRNKKQSGRS